MNVYAYMQGAAHNMVRVGLIFHQKGGRNACKSYWGVKHFYQWIGNAKETEMQQLQVSCLLDQFN